jgi:hypothetical protein
MAKCPSCAAKIAWSASECPACGATFGQDAAWRPIAESLQESQRLASRFPARKAGAEASATSPTIVAGWVLVALGCLSLILLAWPLLFWLSVLGPRSNPVWWVLVVPVGLLGVGISILYRIRAARRRAKHPSSRRSNRSAGKGS